MNQEEAPLYNALQDWKKQRVTSFHVPGHKNGTIFPRFAAKEFQQLLKIDATELTGLDDLHNPTGAIDKAQQLASQYYNVQATFFLVNGSTVGNLAMILGSCNEGDIVLVQRNAHKSIFHGLELANVNPVFLSPFIDEQAQVAVGLTKEALEKALKAYPSTKAIILSNPNYYGMTVDLTDIIQLAHASHIPVLVDEAHGAHFGYGSPFPISASLKGADVVVQSAHKTLPSMTMGSFLHFNSKIINEDKIASYLHMLQSSSPSYPIMASLDLARYYLSQLDEQQVKKIIMQINHFREELNEIDSIRVLPASSHYELDPLKVTIQTNGALNGFQIQERLEKEGIYTELADPLNVLFVFPLAEIRGLKQITAKIKQALFYQKQADYSKKRQSKTFKWHTDYSELVVTYKEMKHYHRIKVPFSEAIGCIAAEAVIPYPPGIPYLIAGEKITKEQIEELMRMIQEGVRLQGGEHVKQQKIYVYEHKGE
ncbi:aminotransferase class I/II-fold pyridoxal phosphate-dependent enzyme [Bacillus taeanensis]|uniref:Arginine decarboxylase n=1 Tax=Bacillus taeanensis TaxID=273032 RepID=A0A366XQ21_9BACI|nr:aminotransferase class I/II-fold pyridoxal phosphate-dependent enzyme [Bacillus taeanensis]RBW67618.1 arginine decarboxylase [Bacillus taeanensis]